MIWKKEEDERVDDILKLKEKERHAKYYRENRKEILKRQKERDKIRDRKTPSKNHYKAHREEILKANRERYQKNKIKRNSDAKRYYWEHREEIAKRRKELRDKRRNENVDE